MASKGFMIFTIIIVTMANFIVTQVFLQPVSQNPQQYPQFYYQFTTISFVILYFMCSWAYIIASFVHPQKVRNNQSAIGGGSCERCNVSKPARAHHCKVCGKCVLKMDHHCVWINRCVSFYNYKAFLLFVFYLVIGAWYFDCLAIQYYLSDGEKQPYWIAVPVVGETVVIAITTFLATSLLIAHALMVLNNLTTIEYISGVPIEFSDSSTVNFYHIGFVANFLQVFGNNPYMWLVPSLNWYREDGQFFPIIPNPVLVNKYYLKRNNNSKN